jgi:C_GCAxxG_C_C family probable redox protein
MARGNLLFVGAEGGVVAHVLPHPAPPFRTPDRWQEYFPGIGVPDEGPVGAHREADGEGIGRNEYEYELNSGSCPQCILRAIQETVGGIDDATIKTAHGLAGGGGLVGEGVCGALTGGLLAVSAHFWRDKDKMEKGRYLNNFKKCKELAERFRREFGGLRCGDLQQRFAGCTFDMWKADEYAEFDKGRGDRCARATATVARWVVEML